MVSGRSWQSVKQGLGGTKPINKVEEEVIQVRTFIYMIHLYDNVIDMLFFKYQF